MIDVSICCGIGAQLHGRPSHLEERGRKTMCHPRSRPRASTLVACPLTALVRVPASEHVILHALGRRRLPPPLLSPRLPLVLVVPPSSYRAAHGAVAAWMLLASCARNKRPPSKLQGGKGGRQGGRPSLGWTIGLAVSPAHGAPAQRSCAQRSGLLRSCAHVTPLCAARHSVLSCW